MIARRAYQGVPLRFWPSGPGCGPGAGGGGLSRTHIVLVDLVVR